MVSKAALASLLSVGVALAFPPAAMARDHGMRGSLALTQSEPLAVKGDDAGEILFSAVQSRADSESSPADMGDPANRLMARTPDDIKSYFDLYLYVSKAAEGPIAQHMFVYQRGVDGGMTMLYDWPVSTGRERKETTKSGRRTFTSTPAGIFKLDPDRFYKVWHSRSWDADMPWAMFLDYTENGGMSGVAIHAHAGNRTLGRRASGGCVRLAPENAKTLFTTITKNYSGLVPIFAMSGSSTNTVGVPARLADGSMELTYGYRVLLHIEDYSGDHMPALSVAASAPSAMLAR